MASARKSRATSLIDTLVSFQNQTSISPAQERFFGNLALESSPHTPPSQDTTSTRFFFCFCHTSSAPPPKSWDSIFICKILLAVPRLRFRSRKIWVRCKAGGSVVKTKTKVNWRRNSSSGLKNAKFLYREQIGKTWPSLVIPEGGKISNHPRILGRVSTSFHLE